MLVLLKIFNPQEREKIEEKSEETVKPLVIQTQQRKLDLDQLHSRAGDVYKRQTQNIGKNFVRSYAGVCMEGAIIALACIIFSVFAASPPAIADSSLSAVNIVWNYVAELIFNLLVLVGAIKAADRIVKEIMGL